MMKKVVFALIVLMLAVPAGAEVLITIAQVGDSNQVSVSYDATSESDPNNFVRAFALDVTVDSGAEIAAVEVNDGEYWVFPGSMTFEVNSVTGDVEINSPGSAICDPCEYLGTLGLEPSGMTIEMGALFPADTPGEAPPRQGELLKFRVNQGCCITVVQNQIRGGVVMQNPAQIFDFNSPVVCLAFTHSISGQVTGDVQDGVTITGLPGAPVTASGGFYTDTVPDGWTGTATPVLACYTFNPTSISYSTPVTSDQTNQDYTSTQITYTISGQITGVVQDGVTITGLPSAPVTAGGGYYTDTVPDGWSGTAEPVLADYDFAPADYAYSNVQADSLTDNYTSYDEKCLDVTATEYNAWVGAPWNEPNCWCYSRQCRGDIDGKKILMKWVQNADLTKFRAAFLLTDAQLSAIPDGICADLDHKKILMKRVQNADLTIFREYFLDAVVPECDQAPIITGPYNFWLLP